MPLSMSLPFVEHLRRAVIPAAIATGVFAALAPVACSQKSPLETTYFERTISPILTTSCVRTNTGAGCHVQDAKGNALGNLDVSTYANLAKRADLTLDYGPYGQAAFFLKNVEPLQVAVQTYDGKTVTVTTDIKHAGGSILDATGSAYQTLRRWLQNGATENNTGVPPATAERLPCSQFIPGRPDFDLTTDPSTPDFALFRDRVNPLFTGQSGAASACAAGNCHGTSANSLVLTCGITPEQVRWNYRAAEEYLAQTPEQSELLRRPLSPAAGGAFHEGGVIFTSPRDDGYVALQDWASLHGPLRTASPDPGFAFFSDKVQPVLVRKGCMMIQCHSSSMFHDYRLRGGSGGTFSLSATRKNYDLSLAQLALDTDDPNASRLLRKNLYRPEVCGVAGCDQPSGIAHRGGPLLEDFPGQTAKPLQCAGPFDYDKGELGAIPAYCVLSEWFRRERQARKGAALSSVLYVRRPLGSGRRAQDFDVYSPGADLRMATITNAGTSAGTTVGTPPGTTAGDVLSVTADTSLTAGCGLDVASADIQRPQVSYDASKVLFAARSNGSEPLAVYEMNADGSQCAKHPEINVGPLSANGLLVHNFDPVYAPPDGSSSAIVFASTRGNLGSETYDYQGPQRTPADPTKPNANLYIWESDPGASGQRRVRQLSFLLNMERMPSFMSDGRLIFSVEKRAPDFYQVALRRLNLDGGDYHPLYAQRGSIGYPEAIGAVELADKDFAAIFRDPLTPHGGGALAIFNRSIGVDFQSGNPADYPIDRAVLDPASSSFPDPNFFLRSLRFPDRANNAHLGRATDGLYASPSALPGPQLLVSFGAASDPASFDGDYDVYVMNAVTGAKTKLLGETGSAETDAVAVYGRSARSVFRSRVDEPNGNVQIVPGRNDAEVHVLDMPVLASLLFQNTPTGRVIDHEIQGVSIYEDLPPPLEVDSFDKAGVNAASDAYGRVYVRRRSLGDAPLEQDGSLKVTVPGGLPLVLKLPDTTLSRAGSWPRFQREEMVFYPGEAAHQSFREDFFGSLCGQCHGSISGRATDAALRPDFVTQASATLARDRAPVELNKPPSERGPIEGPGPP